MTDLREQIEDVLYRAGVTPIPPVADAIMAIIGWRDIAEAPPIGTVAVLYFPEDGYDDAEYGECLDYRYRLAMYRRTPLGDGWHDQGTNHDSFENAEPSGIGVATRYLPLPAPDEIP